MEYISLGGLRVSRLILGSNPFSGFSHQSPDKDCEMMRYYTTRTIKDTLHQAQSLGIDAVVARTDHHVMRFLLEFWDEGGSLQWLAQTCPEVGPQDMCVDRAKKGGARACHVHGGIMDFYLAQGTMNLVPPLIAKIRDSGMLAGIAGHNPEVFRWAENHLDLDYYMCSYYNPTPRGENPLHVPTLQERYQDQDRLVMTELISGLSRPAIHYKIMAAGRNDPAGAFRLAAACLRPNDAVCVGVYTRDFPAMLAGNVELFEKSLEEVSTKGQ